MQHLALAQRRLRPLEVGDVAADRLILDDEPLIVADRQPRPLHMADSVVSGLVSAFEGGQHLCVFRRRQRPLGRLPVPGHEQVDELAPDELLARLADILAIGVVDEGQHPVRQVAANQLRLGLDQGPVQLFAVAQRGLGALEVGDVAADSLILDDAAVIVQDRLTPPLYDEYLTVECDHSAFLGVGFQPRAQVRQHPFRVLAVRGREQIDISPPDQAFVVDTEFALVSVIDEGQDAVRQVTADQFGLGFDQSPVKLLP